MRKWLLLPFCLLFLFSLLPSCARACAQPGVYSSTTWTTHIASISPQAGIAGITKIYIRGYCFGTTYGDGPGLGFVSVGGFRVPAANIVKSPTGVPEWNDAEIVFTLPFTAVSGDLVVTASTSTGYGHDDSAHETGCPRNNGWPSGYNGYYCGNDMINASFTVLSPNNPTFLVPAGSPACPGSQPCPPTGSPSIPQYVGGTWFYSDGGIQDELVLTQGSQNSDGTWTISGTEYPNTGPSGPVTGTLYPSGDLTLAVNNGGTCLEYYILGSGDVTSQGYINGSGGGSQYCVPLPGGFLNDYTTWEKSYWYFAAPPLFKSQTDLPASETPAPKGWTTPSSTQNATIGLWERTLVPFPASVNTFAGRFVFEQYGGTAGDSCYAALSPTPRATGVSGGGWYVTQDGKWGNDLVGITSPGVDWYQKNVSLPCDITLPQQMNIDGMSGPQPYTTNQLVYEIDATKVYSEVQTQDGSVTFECEYYANKTVGNRPCKK